MENINNINTKEDLGRYVAAMYHNLEITARNIAGYGVTTLSDHYLDKLISLLKLIEDGRKLQVVIYDANDKNHMDTRIVLFTACVILVEYRNDRIPKCNTGTKCNHCTVINSKHVQFLEGKIGYHDVGPHIQFF